MKSHWQEFQEKLDQVEDLAHHDPHEAANMLLQAIHEQQHGGGRRACGCFLSCDGFTTIVSWPCRQHWWVELGGPIGGALMLLVFLLLVSGLMVGARQLFGGF